jgi:hypothetical protein
MRKQYLLLLIVLVVASMLFSCSEEYKGGSIEITNNAGIALGDKYVNYYVIVEGVDVVQAWNDLTNNNGTLIEKGAKKTIHFDKDGFYSVVALYPAKTSIPPVFTKTVYLALGVTEKVVIE